MVDKNCDNQSDKVDDKNESVLILKDKEIDDLKNKLNFSNDKLLRLHADFENYKKRIQKERLELIINTKMSIIGDFVSVLNEIEIAISFSDKKNKDKKSYSDLLKGFNLIVDKLKNISKQIGVEFIKVNPGDKFDHNLHMAVASEKNDEYADDCILKQIKFGYKLNGRIIEPALVIVNKREE